MIGSLEAMKKFNTIEEFFSEGNPKGEGKYRILRKLVRAIAISLPQNGKEITRSIQHFFLALSDLHGPEEAGIICLNIIDLHHRHLYGEITYEKLVEMVEDYIAS